MAQIQNAFKTLGVFARIQAGTETSLNGVRQKYYAPLTDAITPISRITLVRNFVANDYNKDRLKKSLAIIASKNVPFSQSYFAPAIFSTRGEKSVVYNLTRGPLNSIKDSILFFNKPLKRIMSTAEAQWESGPTVLNVKVTTRSVTDERALEILTELQATEKPEEFVVDGLLLGDREAVEKGEEEFTFFPFATEETVIRPSEDALRMKEERKEERRKFKRVY